MQRALLTIASPQVGEVLLRQQWRVRLPLRDRRLRGTGRAARAKRHPGLHAPAGRLRPGGQPGARSGPYFADEFGFCHRILLNTCGAQYLPGPPAGWHALPGRPWERVQLEAGWELPATTGPDAADTLVPTTGRGSAPRSFSTTPPEFLNPAVGQSHGGPAFQPLPGLRSCGPGRRKRH